MFLILVNGEKLDFWGNSVGDIFVDNTIEKLSLPKDKVKVLHFSSLKDKPEFSKMSGNDLIIQQKMTNQVEIIKDDGTIEIKTEEILIDDKIISGEVFFENGIFVKPC